MRGQRGTIAAGNYFLLFKFKLCLLHLFTLRHQMPCVRRLLFRRKAHAIIFHILCFETNIEIEVIEPAVRPKP
jgi:hypothetical protein